MKHKGSTLHICWEDIGLKVYVKLSLYLIKHHGMNTYGKVEVQQHAFLTSALHRGEWIPSSTDHFTSETEPPVPTG
jgi:hypothetical protein